MLNLKHNNKFNKERWKFLIIFFSGGRGDEKRWNDENDSK